MHCGRLCAWQRQQLRGPPAACMRQLCACMRGTTRVLRGGAASPPAGDALQEAGLAAAVLADESVAPPNGQLNGAVPVRCSAPRARGRQRVGPRSWAVRCTRVRACAAGWLHAASTTSTQQQPTTCSCGASLDELCAGNAEAEAVNLDVARGGARDKHAWRVECTVQGAQRGRARARVSGMQSRRCWRHCRSSSCCWLLLQALTRDCAWRLLDCRQVW